MFAEQIVMSIYSVLKLRETVHSFFGECVISQSRVSPQAMSSVEAPQCSEEQRRRESRPSVAPQE